MKKKSDIFPGQILILGFYLGKVIRNREEWWARYYASYCHNKTKRKFTDQTFIDGKAPFFSTGVCKSTTHQKWGLDESFWPKDIAKKSFDHERTYTGMLNTLK